MMNNSRRKFIKKNVTKITLISLGGALSGLSQDYPIKCSPVFVSFEPEGFRGREKFTIYVQRPGTNYYVGYWVQHEYDKDEIEFVDYYRICGANEFKYENGTMISLNLITMVNGESECVWRRQDGQYPKADFTGGYHGDETVKEISFYIDQLLITDLKKPFELIPCNEFAYHETSDMHETANVINGLKVAVDGHPVENIHHKITTFKDGGYVTKNKLIWQRNVPVSIWYAGICCIGKMQALRGCNEDGDCALFSGSTQKYLEKVGTKEVNYINDKTGFSAKVITNILSPVNANKVSNMFVWDRLNDSKYYLNYGIPSTVVKGEVWESIMTVKHFKSA